MLVSGVGFVESGYEIDECAFACAAASYEGDGFAGLDGEGDVVEDGCFGVVAEGDVAELDLAFGIFEAFGSARIGDVRDFVENFENAIHRGESFLHQC